MKIFLQSLLLSLLCMSSYGQFVQITHLTGTASYGSIPVTVSATGNYGTGGGDCLITPTPYRVAGAPGNLPGTYSFVCGSPVYAIQLYCERIHSTEYIQVSVNGTIYTLTPPNLTNTTDCHATSFTSISGGQLVGPPGGVHSGGILTITDCSGINSFDVYCNGLVGGSTFYAWIDTTRCLSATSNSPVCVGDTLKLHGSGGDTTALYTWYGPGGYTATGRNPYISSVTASAAGTYTIVQAGGLSKDTATTVVAINPLPVVTAASNSVVCPGSTINLTSGPLSAGETFSWTGPGTYTSAVQNPAITPASIADTGIYTVVATLNGCTDTAATHVLVTYLTLPTDSSNAPLCSGDTLKLFAHDTVSGVTWSWSGPGGYSSATQNPVINGVSSINSGVYTVTATVSGCSLSDTILATVGSPSPLTPYILPHVRICSGTTLSLQMDPATIDPSATYIWSGPNGFTFTGLNPVIPNISVPDGGLYYVYGTIAGCNTTSGHNNFQVDSTPEAPLAYNNGPRCADSLLLLNSLDNTAGVTYSWAGPAGFTSTMQNTSIYNVQTTMAGNYTVTATLLGLCSSSAVTYVQINQTPQFPVVGSNGPVCEGALLLLNASFTPYTGVFHWTGPAGFTSVLQNPSIVNVTMFNAGIYTVSELINGCPSDTVSFNVVIEPRPAVPVASSNAPICEGGLLTFSATDDTAGVAYSWTGPSGFTSTDQNPFIAGVTPATAGLYTVTAILGNCSSLAVVNVNITGSPTVTATSNSPVCSGDTLKLSAVSAPGNTFSWIGPYTPAPLLGPAPVRFPATAEYAGVYQVTTTGPGGCTSVTLDTVVIKPTPPAPWIPWETLCQYAYSPPLMAVDAPNVLWFPTSAGGVGTPTPPIPSTAVPGVYFFFLNSTVNGCVSAIDSVQVIVTVKPDVTVTPADTAICPRDRVEYHASSTDPFATFSWHPSAYLSDTVGKSPVAYPVAGIRYAVVSTNMFGCTDTAFANVDVAPAALISLASGDSISLYPGEAYHIQPVTNCVSFTWFPTEGLSGVHLADPTATPPVSTEYIVQAVTERGCMATDSIFFHLNSETLYGVPNAFSPGTGANNIFKLLDKGLARLAYFRIFNRWGNLVFETTNISEGWDGTYKGDPQSTGVYIYDISAISLITGKTQTMHGNITLLR